MTASVLLEEAYDRAGPHHVLSSEFVRKRWAVIVHAMEGTKASLSRTQSFQTHGGHWKEVQNPGVIDAWVAAY
jgi:hypothetical protein